MQEWLKNDGVTNTAVPTGLLLWMAATKKPLRLHSAKCVSGSARTERKRRVPIAQDDVEKLGRLLALAHPLAELADVVDQPELETDA